MPVTLRSDELEQLQKTIETLLTPIDQATPEAWGAAVMREVKALLGADTALFALPLDGSVHIVGDGDRTADARAQYESDYWQTDIVLSKRRKELGLEVYHRDQLYLAGELRTDVLHNEWCVPNKLFDTLGMGVDISTAPIPAGVHVYHDSDSRTVFGERGALLMSLLAPAFKAAVLSYAQVFHLSRSMSQLVDQVEVGACIVGPDGEVLHQNRALETFYAHEADPSVLRAAVMRVGGSLVLASQERPAVNQANMLPFDHLRTRTAAYDIRGVWLSHPPSSLSGPIGVVFVDKGTGEEQRLRKAGESVKRKYGLTDRELEVAILLARRCTAEEIACRLGISSHTARHHTERVMSKTGVHSRSMVRRLFEG